MYEFMSYQLELVSEFLITHFTRICMFTTMNALM